jgi:hypothetical protein
MILWQVTSLKKIADTSEQVICKLLRLKLQPLPHGWQKWTLMMSHSLVELDSSSAATMLCTYVEEQVESMLNR